MFDFSPWLDLPLIWGVLIATAVFLYVLLDGFDLGVGILFPFAPSHNCRSKMMNSIAPFWDGNETWLVLGGGGLFAAFPLAYSIIMPALYLPVMMMLLGLIFRGVAFEFRFKAAEEKRWVWDTAFHFGSLTAALMQGVILGNIVQGIEVEGRAFSGGPLDWANGFSLMTGVALIFGYALLGATWLIFKTDDKTQIWARLAAKYTLIFVAIFMGLVSICMPFIDSRIYELWFSFPNFFLLLPIPLVTLACIYGIAKDLQKPNVELRPFILTIVMFLTGYLGLAVGLYPWVVPFQVTLWDAAAASTSLSLLLVGTVLFLPLVLAYTAFCFYTFRGKSSHEAMY